MREIKFRVFIKWLKIILEVESIDFVKKRVYCKTEIGKQNPCDFYNFDDVVLMQYTGLKDKNGVEIYEVDIVKLGEYHRTNYENNIAQINWTGYQYTMESHNFSLLLMKTQYIEVIGNIYENPELLKA